jgi:hypothetical protein
MVDPVLKSAAVALLEAGEMRVAEIADLIGESRQLIATWVPSALEADLRRAPSGNVSGYTPIKKQSDIRFATSFPGLSRRGRACP